MSTATLQVLRGFLADHDPRWLAEDVELHDRTRSEPCFGRSEAGAWWSHLIGDSLSDARTDMTRMTRDGSRVAVEWLLRGRHVGSLGAEIPTGRIVMLPMAGIFEVVDGEIRRADVYYDSIGLGRHRG